MKRPEMQDILASVCWIGWAAYLLIWPLDTVISNFAPGYLDPHGEFVQRALFGYVTVFNYLLLAAIVLSALYLLQRCTSMWQARPSHRGILLQRREPTNDGTGFNQSKYGDSDSSLSGRKMKLASLGVLVLLYAISWWFRPFLSAPTILAICWIGVLTVTLCRRTRQTMQS